MPGKYVHLSLTRGTSAACGARNVQSSDGNIDMVDCPRCVAAHTKATAETPTVVIFRKYKSDGEIIALFPEIPGSVNDGSTCSAYVHFGQHCHISTSTMYTGTTVAAAPAEYADLKAELENLPDPYTLRVALRISPKMHDARMAAFRAPAAAIAAVKTTAATQQQRRTPTDTVTMFSVAKRPRDRRRMRRM